MDEFLRLFIMSLMNSLFLLNSPSLMLREPSNRKTRSTVFFVHSVKRGERCYVSGRDEGVDDVISESRHLGKPF